MELLVELLDGLGRENRGRPRTSQEMAQILGGFGLDPCYEVRFCLILWLHGLWVCHLFFLSDRQAVSSCEVLFSCSKYRSSLSQTGHGGGIESHVPVTIAGMILLAVDAL
jgi:hypothetical protein